VSRRKQHGKHHLTVVSINDPLGRKSLQTPRHTYNAVLAFRAQFVAAIIMPLC